MEHSLEPTDLGLPQRGERAGPLRGVRIVEFAGLGPGPFAGMLLADLGADVVKIERPRGSDARLETPVNRGRLLVELDLKRPDDHRRALDLLAAADGLIEGFRPGTMERLGLGPSDVARVNPRLIYGRMTGWGQTGPLSQAAGHDLNYIAITGALHAIGAEDRPPVPPLNLVGDYAGGALYLVIGMLSADRGPAVGSRSGDRCSNLRWHCVSVVGLDGLHGAGRRQWPPRREFTRRGLPIL
jgi:alpha-methylacyl-CoA racemase